MVNILLFLASIASIVVWLIQEKIARPQLEAHLTQCIDGERNLSAEELHNELMPAWSEWLFRGVFALWAAWIASVILVKDGDFALVLVVLTFLTGILSGLDHFLFMARRQVFAQSVAVVKYLSRYVEDQRFMLQDAVGKELVIAEYGKSFFPVLLVVLVLRSFIVEPFQIPSASMVPTLEVGDYILVNKYAYGLRLPVLGTKIVEVDLPERGDVMVFFPPHDSRYFIKRVIGLPGDQIRYTGKELYINGKKMEQTLLAELPPLNPVVKLTEENLGEVQHLMHTDKRINRGDFSTTVKPGHYFMMGDNRDNSSDSRVWGQVPEKNIVGKAFAIWMHWQSFTSLPSFSRVGTIQ